MTVLSISLKYKETEVWKENEKLQSHISKPWKEVDA